VQAPDKTSGRQTRLTILIADDDEDMVLTLAEILRDEGHVVHTCAVAGAVAEAVQRYKPDICLLDIVMPDKTGFAVARQLKALSLERRPVLVAISGVLFRNKSDEVVARSAGFDHFVRKGTDPGEIIRLIDRYDRMRQHVETLANRRRRRDE
jgi:DNA-binding response OmpR family regulator